ncbi:TnsD family Tn7-like transposition protein [Stutzerimonas kunmingensis]|uniref:TnsD family Tn7-like transposition protein n=2 Tax=Pseudomonadaceae TaxID=135621 RepID=UPI0035E45221
MRRLHFFPTPFHDETLHSIFSRYARLDGLGTTRGGFPVDLRRMGFSGNVPFPCHLSDLVDMLPVGTELSVPVLIGRHTLLPYYQPFLTEHQLRTAFAQMSGGNGHALELRLGVIASRLESTSRIRFCPTCVDQDRENLGVAYWHRVHQLPGVWICPHHTTLLKALDHRRFSRCRKRIQLPEDDEVQSTTLDLDIRDEHYTTLLEISQMSWEVLQANNPPCPAWQVRSALLDGAKALGLASTSGRLHLGALAAHMESFFQRLPNFGEFSILQARAVGIPEQWVTKTLRKPRRTRHPLKLLVMASAMKVDLPSFIQKREEALRGSGEHERAGVAQVISRVFPIEKLVLNVAAQPQDLWAMVMQGFSADEMSASLGVSLASVYRAIRAHSDGSAIWQRARYARDLAQRRERFVSQYTSHLSHECSDYVWLHRHDRAWLSAHLQLVGHHRCDQKDDRPLSELDASLAGQVVVCARALRVVPGKPIHITKSRIARELDVVSRFEKQLGRLPLCSAALVAACESTGEFRRRRLLWAMQQLEVDGRLVTPSLLYKTASIRPHTLYDSE